MRIPLLLALTLLVVSATKAQDFRNAKWGMSPDEVRKSTANEISVLKSGRLVEDVVYGKSVGSAFYNFDDNKLVSGFILFERDYDKDSLNTDMVRFLASLPSKYVVTKDLDVEVQDEDNSDTYHELGTAVVMEIKDITKQYASATSTVDVRIYGNKSDLKLITSADFAPKK